MPTRVSGCRMTRTHLSICNVTGETWKGAQSVTGQAKTGVRRSKLVRLSVVVQVVGEWKIDGYTGNIKIAIRSLDEFFDAAKFA